MNMSRHIFSFKSVIFFALVAFLGRRGSVLDLVLAWRRTVYIWNCTDKFPHLKSYFWITERSKSKWKRLMEWKMSYPFPFEGGSLGCWEPKNREWYLDVDSHLEKWRRSQVFCWYILLFGFWNLKIIFKEGEESQCLTLYYPNPALCIWKTALISIPPCEKLFVRLQKEAREQRKGLWKVMEVFKPLTWN